MSADESIQRAEELLQRMETLRARLDAAEAPEQAMEVVEELEGLSKDVLAELTRAKREAEADASA
jgi:hypothetical protein